MIIEDSTGNSKDLERENRLLRERVALLEAELGHQAARANQTIAKLEERVYWLDRWHVDLNSLMSRPGASQIRALLRAIRRPYRWLVNFSRRYRS